MSERAPCLGCGGIRDTRFQSRCSACTRAYRAIANAAKACLRCPAPRYGLTAYCSNCAVQFRKEARKRALGVIPERRGRPPGQERAESAVDLPKLPIGALPERAMAVMTTHEVERHMACAYYNICLNYAERRNWSNFHCGACPLNRLGGSRLGSKLHSQIHGDVR